MDEKRGSLAGVETVDTPSGELTLADYTTELDTVVTGVHGLRTVMVNLFAVSEGDGNWVLIDTGLPGSRSKILEWAVKRYGSARPQAVLLTHGHFDHTGALADLVNEWRVPVYAHEIEIPFVKGEREYPPPDPAAGGGVMSLLSPFYPKKPVEPVSSVLPLPASGAAPGLPSWRWIHTPGHTDGHVSFFRDRDRTLIAGDAVTTTKQESFWAILRQKPELHGPPAYFTSDWAAAKASVQKLAQLRPQWIAAGHGKPLAGDAAADGLAELANRFDELAAPRHRQG